MTNQPPVQDQIDKIIAYGIGVLGLLAGGWKIIESWFEQRRKNKESDITTLKGVLEMARELKGKEDDARLIVALQKVAELEERLNKKDDLILAAQDGRRYAEDRASDLRRDMDERDETIKALTEELEIMRIKIMAMEKGMQE